MFIPSTPARSRARSWRAKKIRDEAVLRAALAERGVGMSRPLGFNDTYAIGMREQVAARLGVTSLSDLRRHPDLKFGFSNEFMDRADGWPGIRDRYGLPQRDVRGLDHDLAYRALASGEIQATDLYSTDAEIRQYNLRVLRDDLNFFPSYECVWLYRADLQARSPAAFAALERLEGRYLVGEMAGDECPGQARSRARRPRRGRFPGGEVRHRGRGQHRDVGRAAPQAAGRAPDARIHLADGGDRRLDPTGRDRGAAAAARPVDLDHDGLDPDDPFAGTSRVHDPLAGDRGQAGPGRALSL